MSREFGHWRRNAWLGIALIGVLLIANAVVSLRSARHFIHNEAAADRAYGLLNAIELVRLTLTDAETRVRGYLITGDPIYLKPYDATRQIVDQAFNDLERYESGNVAQHSLLAELQDVVGAKLDGMAAVIHARQNSQADAQQLFASNEDKSLMDNVRRITQEVAHSAKRELNFLAIITWKSAFRLEATIFLGMAMGVALLAGIAFVMERDYHARCKAETTLIESNRFAHATLDALRARIAILDGDGTIIATNRAWQDFEAANVAEASLKTGGNYLEECDRAKGPSAEAAAIATGIRAILNGEISEYEREYPYRSSNETQWIHERVTPFACAGPVRLAVSYYDITPIKQAEQKREDAFVALAESHELLCASEQQYRALVDAIPQLVGSMLPNGELDYCNQRWLEYTGFTLEQSLGKGWLGAVHPDDREPAFQSYRLAIEAGNTHIGEFRVRRASDGSYRWHLARCVPLRGSDGQIIKWYGTQTDVDDQKRMAEELNAIKDAADAANRAKSEFLANMSHEIRTPMNGVLGMTELLLDTPLSDEQRESVELVKSSAESLMNVINDILDYSKIEARRMELDPIEFQLHDLLQDALKPLALRAHRKGLELACDISRDVPECVVGDPNRLRQVVVNLVGNAIKFAESGEVVLQARLENQNDRDIEVAFAVIDTGIGIAADKLQAVFDPFSQADGSMTRNYGGTGLGLSISSKLVALMGGRLSVDSTLGEGSRFHFQARFVRPELLTMPRSYTDTFDFNGLSVLIVDDNAVNRRVLGEMLRQWDILLTEVATGAEAFAEVARAAQEGEPYQLALVDAVMPEMDGFSLVERLRSQSAFPPPTIMMLTSADRLHDATRCRELNVAAYLVKPIKAADLYRAIVRCLHQPPLAVGAAKAAAHDADVGPDEQVTHLTPRHILLAEDNLVNQRVARGILEKRGHKLVVAGDGNEALQAFARDRFDLVLMDVQMPVMDGLEATEKIRMLEATTGRHTPIVAMTSHAYKSDQQRCLASGMDSFLTKPFTPKDLLATIDRLVSSADSQRSAVEEMPALSALVDCAIADSQTEPVDFEALNARVENDWTLLQEVIELFLDNSPGIFAQIEAAVARGDRQAIERAAHALQGAMLNVAAGPAALAASRLEKASSGQDFDQIAESQANLNYELDRLLLILAAHPMRIHP